MSEAIDPKRSDHVTQALRALLNRHGYGFQYAVIKEAARAYYEGASQWLFEVAEFPVAVRDENTRVDFVLRKLQSRTFLVCECKRADPSRSDWCFATAPYVARDERLKNLMVEHIRFDKAAGSVYSTMVETYFDQRQYHIGIEAKAKDVDSESSGGGRDAISEATAQVLRGVNGLAEIYASDTKRLAEGPAVLFVPIVFTTAQLWGTDADLSTADLQTGKLDTAKVTAMPLKWAVHQAPVSPRLRHQHKPAKQPREFADMLGLQFMRSVIFVQAGAIAEFLSLFEVSRPTEFNWFD